MLAFPQSFFPPQVPVNHHVSVCSPFTLNTRTHVWEHPYQRRWRPGTPRADWRAAWSTDFPEQICLILPQAESSVSLSAWEHICIVPGFLVTLPQDRKWGLSCRSTHGLCTDGKSLSSVQLLSPVQLFVIPWTAACQASLSITNSHFGLFNVMSIESVMPSNHLILCHPVLLLPSVFLSIRVFSNESILHIRWPKCWSVSLSFSPSNEYTGLISFRIDWFDLPEVQGTLKSLLQHHSSEASNG